MEPYVAPKATPSGATHWQVHWRGENGRPAVATFVFRADAVFLRDAIAARTAIGTVVR